MESRSRPCLRASLATPLSMGLIQNGRHFDFSNYLNHTVKRIWSCILIQVSRVYVHRTKWQQKSVTSEPMMTRFIVACIHQASKIYEWNAKFNTLKSRQNGCHFPDYICKWIFLNENISIAIKISLKFVLKGPINNIPALVQIMDWRRSGEKLLSEPIMVS